MLFCNRWDCSTPHWTEQKILQHIISKKFLLCFLTESALLISGKKLLATEKSSNPNSPPNVKWFAPNFPFVIAASINRCFQNIIKQRLHLKAVLTSLIMALLPISRSRFKQCQIPPLNFINQCFAVLCKFLGDF